MSAATVVPALDVSGTPAVPLTRIVKVELRKMGDTRAGMWLLVAIGAISVITIGAFFIWGNEDQRTFMDLFGYAGIPQGVLLPILGILLVTQEWGQRTALVTFTQIPHRGKVLLAKTVAAVMFAIAAMLLAMAVAAPLALVGGSEEPFGELTAAVLGRIVIGLVIGILWGLAFGGALLNSAFAIVAYFVVPTVISIVSEIWTSATEGLRWVDLGTSQGTLFTLEGPSSTEWAQIGTGFLVWVVLPGLLGVWRILRSEVK